MTQELTAAPEAVSMDILRILEGLPHRYPFLMVDRVIACEPGKSIRAYKCVSINEPFFQGHFPGRPVMPGVLIMEALAQAGGIMVIAASPAEEMKNKLFLFSGMENVRFRRPVYPGDRLELECSLLRKKFNIWKIEAVARVDDAVVAEAQLSAAIVDKGDV